MTSDQLRVIALDAVCDRCKKLADKLFTYKLSEVRYRGKILYYPWLCQKCFNIEREKAWKERRIYGINIPMRDENDAI